MVALVQGSSDRDGAMHRGYGLSLAAPSVSSRHGKHCRARGCGSGRCFTTNIHGCTARASICRPNIATTKSLRWRMKLRRSLRGACCAAARERHAARCVASVHLCRQLNLRGRDLSDHGVSAVSGSLAHRLSNGCTPRRTRRSTVHRSCVGADQITAGRCSRVLD